MESLSHPNLSKSIPDLSKSTWLSCKYFLYAKVMSAFVLTRIYIYNYFHLLRIITVTNSIIQATNASNFICHRRSLISVLLYAEWFSNTVHYLSCKSVRGGFLQSMGLTFIWILLSRIDTDRVLILLVDWSCHDKRDVV